MQQGKAGVRLFGLTGLAEIVVAANLPASLVRNRRPVRAILFDKSEAANWGLGWHQDRTIAVKAKADVPRFGPWSVKARVHHVEPPFDLIERMVTTRFHLDDVDEGNAPLLIAPGSHRVGKIAECNIDRTVERCGSTACLADAGDIWVYSTPIIHASKPANPPRKRRVLQVDYSADNLPNPLEWLGL